MTQATERLHKLFRVDFIEGKLYYRRRDDAPAAWNAKWPGREAGTTTARSGHVVCAVDGGFVRKCHIIFAMKHGRFPKGIRHRDGNLHNNALTNLEEVIAGRALPPRKSTTSE